jgi:hypothetical protein
MAARRSRRPSVKPLKRITAGRGRAANLRSHEPRADHGRGQLISHRRPPLESWGPVTIDPEREERGIKRRELVGAPTLDRPLFHVKLDAFHDGDRLRPFFS